MKFRGVLFRRVEIILELPARGRKQLEEELGVVLPELPFEQGDVDDELRSVDLKYWWWAGPTGSVLAASRICSSVKFFASASSGKRWRSLSATSRASHVASRLF